MNIAIVGAGIVGVATAYELAADGHAVTVYERHGAAALEASFAPGGVASPASIAPWARPLLGQKPPLRIGWPVTARELAWLLRARRSRQDPAWQQNLARLRRLAVYSRARLHGLGEALQLEYDRSAGFLVLLRTEKERKLAQAGLAVLRDAGLVFRELDEAQARAVEPGLNADTPLAAAVLLPDDEVGNCRQFALLLRAQAEALGARFVFQAEVAALAPAAPATLQVATAAGTSTQRHDAVVVCSGTQAGELLRPLGLRIPLVALHGYSISAPIREALHAPRSGVLDERHQVAITRLGNRVRVAGGAELGGDPARKRPDALQALYRVLHDWFPGAAQLANTGAAVQEWKGAQAMLPDGPPLLGATGLPGVWINLGHGGAGWALACGSARIVADLVQGRAPEVDLEGLGVERLLG